MIELKDHTCPLISAKLRKEPIFELVRGVEEYVEELCGAYASYGDSGGSNYRIVYNRLSKTGIDQLEKIRHTMEYRNEFWVNFVILPPRLAEEAKSFYDKRNVQVIVKRLYTVSESKENVVPIGVMGNSYINRKLGVFYVKDDENPYFTKIWQWEYSFV